MFTRLSVVGAIITAISIISTVCEKVDRLRNIKNTIDKVSPLLDRDGRRDLWRDLVKDSVPYLDLPDAYRMPNYARGSCVHASMETLFLWQGQPTLAKWWRESYSGGEYSDRLNRRLDAAGVRYAYSRGADCSFLEKCCALRLGCAVNYPQNHMVTLVGIDAQNVYIVDNNSTWQVTKIPRATFARSWTGWAVTPIYQPPPPKPYQIKETAP